MVFGVPGWGLGDSDLGSALCVFLSVSHGLGVVCVGFGVVLNAGSFTFFVTIEDLSATPGPGFDCFGSFFSGFVW